MKTFVWIALVYAGLFGIMAAVNEAARSNTPRHGTAFMRHATIHPRKASKESCSWECYYNTKWCKENHVGINPKWQGFTDIPYFAIIDALKSMGSYTFANIIFLVLIIPTAILWLLVRSIEIEISIRKLNRKA